jgi:large subunit ribosomal protein L15
MEQNSKKIGQHTLKPPAGAKHKRKRVGCGNGSGHGTYSGRGLKGQKSRAGGGTRLGFEGGQLPIIKRLPRKRGFFNSFSVEYNIVNIAKLNQFAPDTEVGPQLLLEAGLIKSIEQPIKVLGEGEVDRSLVVKAHKFSATAKAKIEAAGGRAEGI